MDVVTCNNCKRAGAKDTMWALCGNGTDGWECRVDVEACNEERRRLAGRTAEKDAEMEARNALLPSTDAEFFAAYGIRVDELSPGPKRRDARRHYVHLPSGRAFQHSAFNTQIKRWSEASA